MSMKPRKNKQKTEKAGSTAGQVDWLTIVGARQNNLRDIDVSIPLARFVCVTGVSGSGKSSLVNDIIRETLARDLNGISKARPGEHDRIEGSDALDKVIDINQSPIGRTPRSNPATYIKVFDEIRTLYAKLSDARIRGYKPGRFSFNVKTGIAGGGRCEACEGHGSNRMEMDFLADIWVTCPVCQGKRFSHETLLVLFKGKNIADVLDMDVQQAIHHFENVPKVVNMLRCLHEVGLDYLKLGQSSTTLSGGEAQRIKLARELVKRSTGKTLYILDEPTTGLHFDDIKKLLIVLHGFVDAGNTVLVIEHNLDVVKTADWVIDLGPEGGAKGGKILAQGTPEHLAKSKRSHTGVALKEVLAGRSNHLAAPNQRNGAKAKATRKRKARNAITVVGASQHNLKNITVEIPRDKTTVFCGPSGSGKTSLAIDTIYSEGQRRYVESLSAYARQFLSRMQPPKVERVDGLSPSICIEQRTATRSPRSTVGTITEIYDYMRVLWARIGKPYCPTCKIPIGTQSSDEIVEKVLALGQDRKLLLLAPIEPTGNESYEHLFKREKTNGYARVRIDGVVCSLDDPIEIDRKRDHHVELVVDRVTVRKSQASRIAESVEHTLSVGQGVILVQAVDANDSSAPNPKRSTGSTKTTTTQWRFSQHHACDQCSQSYDALTPHHFSFNSRLGWCDACEGLGTQQGASSASIIVHPTRSMADGAIAGWNEIETGTQLHTLVLALANHIGFELDTPWNRMKETHRLSIMHGCGEDWIDWPTHSHLGQAVKRKRGSKNIGSPSLRFRWRGFFPAIAKAARSSWQYRKRLQDMVTEVPCDTCAGGRLRRESAAVRVSDKTLHEACLWPLSQALAWFTKLKLSARDRKIAGELIHEISSRLRFLVDVGLDYVSIHRSAATLSGGESQRIQLASQIGTGLTGVLYVLDEPTIGLHPRDNRRLLDALDKLKKLGNTLILVEHDREVINAADHVLDFGPGAGLQGGKVTAAASPAKLRSKRASLTGSYLAGRLAIAVPSNRRKITKEPRTDLEPLSDDGESVEQIDRTDSPLNWLIVHGAREQNLKEIDASFPLGRFTCVTGVSGSGKSTLVNAILYNALAARIHRAKLVPGGHERITGIEHIDKVINVDQSPIGNSPTSNPATYTGTFDAIRDLFSKLPTSKIRGYSANRFSFNRTGGRCEACDGMGQRCIEMHFLPDIWVTCETCQGKRYTQETLDAQYHGQSIADVLAMPVTNALELFQNVPKIARMLRTLDDVGLGYLSLGQAAPTLSGGESQRVKLAAELGRPSTGKTLYILDEPTTGLHFDDLKKLLAVLHRLVDLGNTCICIEHNLDVIKTADWMIDLGPEAGDQGGDIVEAGTPETIARCQASHTGRSLKPILKAGPVEKRIVHTTAKQWALNKPLTKTIDLGQDVKMPWDRDGQTWHTVDHVDHQGVPIEWDPKLLLWLVETIESIGSFTETNWRHRSRIEIKTGGTTAWFCHMLTGSKDLLEVALRVREGAFAAASLAKHLKLPTLDERRDLPIYGQWNRVRLRQPSPGWLGVHLYLRDFKDINKSACRTFLKKAIASHDGMIQDEKQVQLIGAPWSREGLAWHLSQKGINPGHVRRWKPDLLATLAGQFKALQPDLVFDWNSKTAGTFTAPNEQHHAGKIVTNMGKGLRVEIIAPHGEITPALIDKLGEAPQIKVHQQYDRIVFWLRSINQYDTKQLRALWRQCRTTFSEAKLQSA